MTRLDADTLIGALRSISTDDFPFLQEVSEDTPAAGSTWAIRVLLRELAQQIPAEVRVALVDGSSPVLRFEITEALPQTPSRHLLCSILAANDTLNPAKSFISKNQSALVHRVDTPLSSWTPDADPGARFLASCLVWLCMNTLLFRMYHYRGDRTIPEHLRDAVVGVLKPVLGRVVELRPWDRLACAPPTMEQITNVVEAMAPLPALQPFVSAPDRLIAPMLDADGNTPRSLFIHPVPWCPFLLRVVIADLTPDRSPINHDVSFLRFLVGETMCAPPAGVAWSPDEDPAKDILMVHRDVVLAPRPTPYLDVEILEKAVRGMVQIAYAADLHLYRTQLDGLASILPPDALEEQWQRRLTQCKRLLAEI
jgi:hypothetical protein